MKNPAAPAGQRSGQLAFHLRRLVLAGAAALAALPAFAGYVTTNEAAMDAIFAQSSFGANAIDIRYNAVVTLNLPSLLDIGTESEFDSLGGLVVVPQHTALAFFVDTISWCGGPGGSIIGCGQSPGSVFAVDSSWAASATHGAPLIAHELAHNLGLGHVADQSNLMNPTLYGNSALNGGQVTTILANSLVQTDGLGQRYISITPVAVVPEPEIGVMLSAGLLAISGMAALRGRRVSGA